MRSFARLGSSVSVKGSLRVTDKLYFGGEKNYVQYVGASTGGVDTAYNFYALDTSSGNPTRRMSMGRNAVGTLHGTWESDNTINVVSDRRLKRNIRPLYKALIDEHISVTGNAAATKTIPSEWHMNSENNTTDLGNEPLASKMFRQLRPVAFQLKTDIESKRTSFGFIAQELQALYPSVVRETKRDGQMLTVSYTDLIAVITLTVQQEMTRLDMVQDLLKNVEGVASKHETALQDSESQIALLEQELLNLKKSYTERVHHLSTQEGR